MGLKSLELVKTKTRKKKKLSPKELSFLKNLLHSNITKAKGILQGFSESKNLFDDTQFEQIKRQNEIIDSSKLALKRMDNGGYGLDALTQKLIPFEQLKANPARTSICLKVKKFCWT